MFWHMLKSPAVAGSLKADFILKIIVPVASLLAAGFWFASAQVDIPENQEDAIIAAIKLSSSRSAWAASWAGVASICLAILFILEWELWKQWISDPLRNRWARWRRGSK